MSIPQAAVTAATKAFGDHVKANSVGIPDRFGSGMSFALNPSVEECLTVALTAALPHLPNYVGVMRVGCDAEADARSFNRGYETAIAQMHAPDDRVLDATDWFQEQLDKARAQGVREAADKVPELPGMAGGLVRRWRVKAWLLDLADTIHPILPKPTTPKVGTDA